MMTTRIARLFATLGPVGYVRASGTVATVLTLPLVYVLHTAQPMVELIITCALIIGAFVCVHYAAQQFAEHDPSAIVVDEVAGCLVTFYSIKLSLTPVVLGFALFRLLDIFKPFVIARAEKLPGMWGIMSDDLLAGLIANVILRMICV